MVLKFFETLDSVAEYIEKEENEMGVKYIKRSVAKDFGSDSELAQSLVDYRSTIPGFSNPRVS